MSQKSDEDKRRYIRFDTNIKVSFKVKDKAKGGAGGPSKSISAIAKNLSVEGICFSTKKKLEQGKLIELEILLPGRQEPLHLTGVVCWIKPLTKKTNTEKFDIGIKLFTINRNDEARFLGYISDKMMQRLSEYLHL